MNAWNDPIAKMTDLLAPQMLPLITISITSQLHMIPHKFFQMCSSIKCTLPLSRVGMACCKDFKADVDDARCEQCTPSHTHPIIWNPHAWMQDTWHSFLHSCWFTLPWHNLHSTGLMLPLLLLCLLIDCIYPMMVWSHLGVHCMMNHDAKTKNIYYDIE